MKSTRWIEITLSQFAWEREALVYIKARLPDGEPFRARSNFEFIADDGSVNEVDLLVVSIHKVYLVEIKSWSGVISGDRSTWRREKDGNEFLVDNPLLLANRKAKKLISLLKTQKALAKQRRPYVEAVVFLSCSGVRCRLDDRARTSYASSTLTVRSSGGDDDVAVHADALDERLDRVVKTRGFLALSVAPRYLSGVERYLATTLELTFFSLEAGLIRHMHTVAEELGANWKVVVAADAAPSGSADRRRLDQLVRRASPGLGREIANRQEPLLLTRPAAWMRPGRAWLARAGERRRGDGAAADVDGPGVGQAFGRSASGAHLICATISP